MVYLLAVVIGIVAGLRAFTPLALVSWATRVGWLELGGSRLAFLGYAAVPWILTILALGELVTDQLPKTPSRKIPIQFGARVVSGAICGAALGMQADSFVAGMLLGAIGAIIGTLGGARARERLAQRFGKDRPAALLEDVTAAGVALLTTVVFA